MGDDDPSDQVTDDHITTVFLQKPIHTQTLAKAIFTGLWPDDQSPASSNAFICGAP
jgi:hypothetical protein